MATILIRQVDDNIALKLDEMAKKRGKSREEFLRIYLKNLTLENELKNVENKYTSLVEMLADQLKLQNDVIEKNSYLMDKVIDKL